MPRYSTMLAALGVLLLAPGISRAADVSVAVLGLEPVEIPEPLAQQLTDALRQRASSTSGVRTVQGKDLIEVKMVFGCDGELPACMAQAGKTLGADKLLYGTIKKGAAKNTVTVALKLLDVKTAVVEKFVNDTVQKRELAGSNVAGVAGRWFAQLVEVDTKPTLTVTSDPSGANVSVDGQGYGRTPLTLRELTPGTHSVTVTMTGRQPFTRSVELRPGGSHDVVATLEPEA
ncbi:MAG TPA: PEGA domain-containing protein, partial [Polyangia bacterium]